MVHTTATSAWKTGGSTSTAGEVSTNDNISDKCDSCDSKITQRGADEKEPATASLTSALSATAAAPQDERPALDYHHYDEMMSTVDNDDGQ